MPVSHVRICGQKEKDVYTLVFGRMIKKTSRKSENKTFSAKLSRKVTVPLLARFVWMGYG